MGSQVASYYPERISVFVPNMEFSADVNEQGQCLVSLGAPVTLDADGILAAQSVTTAGSATSFATTYSSTAMGPYGRNVTAVCSSTNTDVLTIHGRDYLNQRMTETLTLTSATTVAGKKAFKYIDKIVWLDQSGITVDVGWGDVMGLPYKATSLVLALEGVKSGDDTPGSTTEMVSVIVADAVSGQVNAPIDGYWVGWQGEYTTAMTTAASVITAFAGSAGTTAQAALDGIAPIGAIGLLFGARVTKANRVAVAKGDICKLTSDGAGTVGVADLTFFFVGAEPVFTQAVLTDPQTAITGDPRGTVDFQGANDGSTVFQVIVFCDRTNLHGVSHFYSG